MSQNPLIKHLSQKLKRNVEINDSLDQTYVNLISFLKGKIDFFDSLGYSDLIGLLFHLHYSEKGLSPEQIDNIIDGLRVVIVAENTGEQSMTDCSSCGGESQFECDSCGGGGERQCDWCGGTGEIKCDDCDGSGEVGGEPCSTCQGGGEVECPDCQGNGEYECDDCSGYGNIDCDSCNSDGKVDYDDHLNSNIWFFLVSETFVESKNIEQFTKLTKKDLDSIMKKSYSFTDVDDIPLKLYTAIDLRTFPKNVDVVLDVLDSPSDIFNLIFIEKHPTWDKPHLSRISLKHTFNPGDEELGYYLSRMI